MLCIKFWFDASVWLMEVQMNNNLENENMFLKHLGMQSH